MKKFTIILILVFSIITLQSDLIYSNNLNLEEKEGCNLKMLKEMTNSSDEKIAVESTFQFVNEIGVRAKNEYRATIVEIIENLNNIVVKFPESAEAPKALYRVASLYEKELGDSEKATEILGECIANYPNNAYSANAYHKLADIYIKKYKDYHEALGIYERCAMEYGNLAVGAEARLKMIDLLKDKISDNNRAIDAMKNFIYLYPDHAKTPSIHCRLSRLYEETGNIDESIKTTNALISNYPDLEVSKKEMLKLARFYRDGRDYEKEAEILENFMNKYPKAIETPRIAFMIGEIYETNFIKYKRQREYNGKKIKGVAMYKLLRGSYRDAIKKFEEVNKKYPDTEWGRTALLKIADIYTKKLYEKHNAKEYLSKLSDDYTNSKEGKLASKLLQEEY